MTGPTHPVSTQRVSRPWWIDAIHVFALSGIAVAQPLFDILRRNPTFFIAHGTDAEGIVLFALVLVLIPPAVMVAVLAVVGLVSRRTYRVLHTAAIGLLAGLTLLPVLGSSGAGSLVTGLVFVVVSVIASLAYAQIPAVGRYATILVAAPVVLVVLFLFFSPVNALLERRGGADTRSGLDGAGTPVVMLLMDEFSQGSLLTPDGSIDRKRFPNFERLARRSTWYPNATTNTNATHVALPTILTGRFPRSRTPPAPVHSSYPNNLFSALAPSYETSVDEWVTALCPIDACRKRTVVYSDKHLVADTALIYLHLVLPARLKASLPPLGHQWAGFFANPADNEERLPRFPRAIRPIARTVMDWLGDDEFRSQQLHRFSSFLRSIDHANEATFSFLHLGLPHQPWHLLPNARLYDRQETPGLDRTNLRWVNEDFADAGLQRYELQVKATDHLIGDLVEHLERQDMWDESLVVVLADHGVAFDPLHTTRAVIGSEGDMLPIPLFVKYPNQRRSKVDERNAEIVDVLPTIADVVDIDIPWHVDGDSLAGPDPERPTKRFWASGRALPPYDLDITLSKVEISERIRRLFGKSGRPDDLFAFGPHRGLTGRAVDELTIGRAQMPMSATLENGERWAAFDPRGPFVPARASGKLGTPVAPEWIAVALNGTVAGMGKPWREGDSWLFHVMVSDSYLKPGRNNLDFFGVGDDGQLFEIRLQE